MIIAQGISSLFGKESVANEAKKAVHSSRFGLTDRFPLGTPSPWMSVGRQAKDLVNPNSCLGH